MPRYASMKTSEVRSTIFQQFSSLPSGMRWPQETQRLNGPSLIADYLSSTDEDPDDVPVEDEPLFPQDDRPILGVAGGGVYVSNSGRRVLACPGLARLLTRLLARLLARLLVSFFFWEVGVLKYLSERYRLQEMNMIGVSAGALASVLVACEVDLDRAVRRAYDISVERDIFNRPGGLQGIWGSILRQWLDDLLPEDAHERCVHPVDADMPRVSRLTAHVSRLILARQVSRAREDYRDADATDEAHLP